jgi:hypothetical protein
MSVANREFKFDVQHQIILPESENQKTIAALSYGTGSVSDRTRVGEVQAFVPRAKLAELWAQVVWWVGIVEQYVNECGR